MGSNNNGIVSDPVLVSNTKSKTASMTNAVKVINTAQSDDESPLKLVTSDLGLEEDQNI